jgi:hypothetical protein
MRASTLDRRRVVAAWRRVLREEEGVALVLARVSMLVLTIMLTAVIFITAAGEEALADIARESTKACPSASRCRRTRSSRRWSGRW